MTARDLGYYDGFNAGLQKEAGAIDSIGNVVLKLLGKAPDKLAAPALSAAAHGMPAGLGLAAQRGHVVQNLGGFGAGLGGGLGLMALSNAGHQNEAQLPPQMPVR